ncbi:hypothetical protein [Psychroserpens ponticola]|uniref:DUF2927 domain-containing protein n=1 Tax=Psychroserpens ponticola TaxID=2932268 RepID=A0ABY7S368_9FLAO|nr:hypothetical protein [Psychroserpens ponticola]WCO03336.1 hypothetical protein MUN68_007490 [Psychroserpens ponticola]
MFNKQIVILFVLCFTFNCHSQIDVSSVLPIRVLYTKDINDADKMNYVVTSKDTFYAKSKVIKNLNHLKSGAYDVNTMNSYLNSVFPFKSKSCIEISHLNQWTSSIVIYFDKDIPKETIKDIKAFYKDISSIKNFNIIFTKDINEANYRIKLTSEILKKKSVCFSFDNIKNEEKFIFNNCKYSLIPDSNNNVISCILEVNDKLLKDKELLLSNIKQALFLSFCHFYPDHFLENDNSFLSTRYKNNDVISDFDLNLLKIHYAEIYNCKVEKQTLIDLYHLVN